METDYTKGKMKHLDELSGRMMSNKFIASASFSDSPGA